MDGFPWCHLAYGLLSDSQRDILPLPCALVVHNDLIGILSILYWSGFDLNLSLLDNFLSGEDDWDHLDMKEKCLGY